MRFSGSVFLGLLLSASLACTDGPTGLAAGEVAATIHFHQETTAFVLAVVPTTPLDSIRIGPAVGSRSMYTVIGPIRGRFLVYAPDGVSPTVHMRLFMNSNQQVKDLRVRVLETADSTGVVREGGATVTIIR